MKMIILRPTGKDSWSGIIKYKNCHEDLAPYYTRSGRIYTGLTQTDEERLGGLLGLDLRSGSDFWKNFHIRTSGKDIYLDLDDPMDELKYLFLKNHKRVANGIGDHKATANFILINQEAEAVEANNAARIRRKAIVELGKLGTAEMRQVLRLFGHNADTMSEPVVEQRVTDIVEANPEKFLERWVNNTTKDTEYLIKTAVSKNILRKVKTSYKYGTDVLGYTLEDAIDYLDKTENQDIKLLLLNAIKKD
jgi:hypothetical protein